jgi:hypothetical protein
MNSTRYLRTIIAIVLSIIVMDANAYITRNADQLNDFTSIVIKGDREANGFFDPSIEYGPDGVGWMAYSRVRLKDKVETRLATSTDHGLHWRYVTTINPSRMDTVYRHGKAIMGVWRYETPSLVYDRGDVADRRWKIFSQHYFVKAPYDDADRDMANGWIEYRYAPSPRGPWSEPCRLFGKSRSGARINLNALDVSLRKMVYYNEIGSLENDGVLYLSMDASTTASGLGDWRNRKIVLFLSYDHGLSWSYAGVMTNYADARRTGHLAFTGSSLVAERGRLFALITPTDSRGHDGTYVVEFEDISTARLKRDSRGRLLVAKVLNNAARSQSGGLSDYDEQNTAGGILLPQIMTNHFPTVYQTFDTGERLIN